MLDNMKTLARDGGALPQLDSRLKKAQLSLRRPTVSQELQPSQPTRLERLERRNAVREQLLQKKSLPSTTVQSLGEDASAGNNSPKSGQSGRSLTSGEVLSQSERERVMPVEPPEMSAGKLGWTLYSLVCIRYKCL